MNNAIFIIPFLFFFSAACKKNPFDSSSLSRSEILMKYKWMNYKRRVLTYKDSTDIILQDTTYTFNRYSPDSCYLNALYVFSSDSLVERNFQCFNPVYTGKGKWFFNNDSMFSASIYLRTSYGSGSITSDFGIPYGKVIFFSEKEMTVKSFSHFYNSDTTYNIYYLKSVD